MKRIRPIAWRARQPANDSPEVREIKAKIASHATHHGHGMNQTVRPCFCAECNALRFKLADLIR